MIAEGSDFLSGLTFQVSDFVDTAADAVDVAAGVAMANSGGFAMSQDGMLILLDKAKSTQGLISQQLGAAERIAQITPPGHDASSVEFTNTAIDSGESYRKHLHIQLNRYTALIEKLNEALGITVETDQQNADAAKQVTAEPGPKY